MAEQERRSKGVTTGPSSGSRNDPFQTERGSASQPSEREAIRRNAGDLASKAEETAKRKASEQKESAVERIRDVGRALHETSDHLREREDQKLADLIDGAAGQIDRLSGYLRERSVDDLLSEVRHVARRDPGLFLGGAALLGMVGARFFRSSARHGGPHTDTGRRGDAYTDVGRGDAFTDVDRGDTRTHGRPSDPRVSY